MTNVVGIAGDCRRDKVEPRGRLPRHLTTRNLNLRLNPLNASMLPAADPRLANSSLGKFVCIRLLDNVGPRDVANETRIIHERVWFWSIGDPRYTGLCNPVDRGLCKKYYIYSAR